MPRSPFYSGPIASAMSADIPRPAPSLMSSLASPISQALTSAGDAGSKRAEADYRRAETAHSIGAESRDAAQFGARAKTVLSTGGANVPPEQRASVVSQAIQDGISAGGLPAEVVENVGAQAAALGWEDQAARLAYAGKGFKLGKDDAMSVSSQGNIRAGDFAQEQTLDDGKNAAKMYGDDQQLAGAKYGADKSLAGSIYGANAQAGSSRYATDTGARTATRGQDSVAATEQRGQDIKANEARDALGRTSVATETSGPKPQAATTGFFGIGAKPAVPQTKVTNTVSVPGNPGRPMSPIMAAVTPPQGAPPVGPAPAPAVAAPVQALRPTAPPQAVQALRANPQLAKDFDVKYGMGASAAALGAQ